MHVAFPYRLDGRGRTAESDPDVHVRDLVEQVLFVSPGERVNRPTFGSGIMSLVFAPLGDEVATAVRFQVQGALQRWLADVVEVEEVSAEAEDATLLVTVRYVVRRTEERRVATFTREV